MDQRACFECGSPVNACMGFVLARDFLLAIKGKLAWHKIRERCWRCVERINLSQRWEKYKKTR